jgi:hypothetical protein
VQDTQELAAEKEGRLRREIEELSEVRQGGLPSFCFGKTKSAFPAFV